MILHAKIIIKRTFMNFKMVLNRNSSFLYYLFFLKRNNRLIVLCNGGIGDSLIVAFFLDQLKKERGKEELFVVCKKTHKDIFESYKCIDKLICNSNLAKGLNLKCEGGVFCENNVDFVNGALCNIPLENRMDKAIDGYFTKVLKLKGNKKIEYPDINMSGGMSYSSIEDKNTIIIFPYAYSCEELDMVFWIKLVEKLREKKYKVLTNISQNKREKPIIGTKEYKVCLNRLLVDSERVFALIGIRSGILDWLACARCNIICVDNTWGEYWDLNSFSINPVINIKYDDINKTVDEIMDGLVKFKGN